MAGMTAPAAVVHTTMPGGRRPRCGADDTEATVSWEQVTDTDHPGHFDCGDCLDHAREGKQDRSGP